MSRSLDRSRIMELFGELSTALEEQGVRGHVYLVGGSALIAGYGRKRTTKDVDGRIDDARDEVFAAVERVGRRNGMGDASLSSSLIEVLLREPLVRWPEASPVASATCRRCRQASVGSPAARGLRRTSPRRCSPRP